MAFVGHFAASGRLRTKVLADMGIAKLTFHSCALPLPRVIEQCVRRLAGDMNLYCEEYIEAHDLGECLMVCVWVPNLHEEMDQNDYCGTTRSG